MTEFEVGGFTYRASKLDVFQQARVTKRLAAVLGGVVTPDMARTLASALTLSENQAEQGEAGAEKAKADRDAQLVDLTITVLPRVAEAFNKLTDDDAEIVIRTCLSAVSRQLPGAAGWARVVTPGGQIMFEDIDFVEAMQISWRVVEPFLQRFFPTKAPASPEPAAGQALKS